MKTEPNEGAYPIKDEQAGLTKREYFAAMAIQGFITTRQDPENVASQAVYYADALIKALNLINHEN